MPSTRYRLYATAFAVEHLGAICILLWCKAHAAVRLVAVESHMLEDAEYLPLGI